MISRDRVAWLLGLPGVGLAAVLASALLLAAGGLPPFTDPGRMTLAEAAALESDADVVRLLRAGVDPNAPAQVRRTRIRPVGGLMTPLEAAMTSRHVSVMDLLVEGGATLDAVRFPALWCVAASQRNADAQAWLRARVSEPAPTDCSAIAYPKVGR